MCFHEPSMHTSGQKIYYSICIHKYQTYHISHFRASGRLRSGDLIHGKDALYQLSYRRMFFEHPAGSDPATSSLEGMRSATELRTHFSSPLTLRTPSRRFGVCDATSHTRGLRGGTCADCPGAGRSGRPYSSCPPDGSRRLPANAEGVPVFSPGPFLLQKTGYLDYR